MNLFTDVLRHRWRLLLLSAFILLCVLFGGSSRTDNVSMLVIRPLSVIYIVIALLLPGQRVWEGLRRPLLLLLAFAATMAIQLVPLPPATWLSLPGHARFAEAAVATGLAQPWRPISLMPDMTINSLLALVVPLAALVGTATIAPHHRRHLAPVLLAAMIASAVLGIAQWAGGPSSPLYFYRYSNNDLPVGFFANRNHQAAFLAMALPLLRVWAVLPSDVVKSARTRSWLAGTMALLLLLVILATGSRSGFVLAIVGSLAAIVIAPPNWRSLLRIGRSPRRRVVLLGTLGTGIAALVATVVMLGRAVSITRLAEIGQVEADLRIKFFPIVVRMMREYLPFGTGYGTFEDLFHVYEPLWALKRTNFNHAHNDLIELVMTGGVAALLVLLIYIGFLMLRIRAIFAWGRRRSSAMIAASGVVIVLMAFAASLTDYPLRTPGMAMLFALATAWLAAPLSKGYASPNAADKPSSDGVRR